MQKRGPSEEVIEAAGYLQDLKNDYRAAGVLRKLRSGKMRNTTHKPNKFNLNRILKTPSPPKHGQEEAVHHSSVPVFNPNDPPPNKVVINRKGPQVVRLRPSGPRVHSQTPRRPRANSGRRRVDSGRRRSTMKKKVGGMYREGSSTSTMISKPVKPANPVKSVNQVKPAWPALHPRVHALRQEGHKSSAGNRSSIHKSSSAGNRSFVRKSSSAGKSGGKKTKSKKLK